MSKIFCLFFSFILFIHFYCGGVFLNKIKKFSKNNEDDLHLSKNDANMQSTKIRNHYFIKQIKGFINDRTRS